MELDGTEFEREIRDVAHAMEEVGVFSACDAPQRGPAARHRKRKPCSSARCS